VARGFYQQQQEKRQQQQQKASSRFGSNHEDNRCLNASRRKAERLIANHFHNHNHHQFNHHQPNNISNFCNFSQNFNPPQISMRLACNRSNLNDFFIGAQYHDTGRNHKSSFYYTKNREDSN